ncbi:hypothetical protein DAETH_19130 [Deinococcus aetherius]|uniref:Uncharacterized protein n=1 Tax=Deinococcus aetherius TaxID=200252 RepID=A0ABM8ADR7_9DEIO|nr:hypothetical protein DAETH_19130 [Deinococcus aetherius]
MAGSRISSSSSQWKAVPNQKADSTHGLTRGDAGEGVVIWSEYRRVFMAFLGIRGGVGRTAVRRRKRAAHCLP